MSIPRLFIARTADGQDLPLPTYTSAHHVGLNLQAAVSSPIRLNPNERAYVPVGFAIGIPDGYCGQIVSVPELAKSEGIIILDGPQILHPADRGPLFVLVQNTSQKTTVLRRGLVCAQLVIMPVVQVCWNEVDLANSGDISNEKKIVLDVTRSSHPSAMVSTRRPVRSLRHRYQSVVPDEK